MEKHTFKILHTNDLHSQLENWPAVTELLKSRIHHARELNEEYLLFDIGDHCDRVHPLTEALLGSGNVELLNDMNYDAVTIGNNEGITFSKGQLNSLYKDASFPVLLSNLKNNDGTLPSWAEPYKIFTLKSGVKIGVTGATAPFRLFYETLGWKITDPMEALQQAAAELADKTDFLICLSHLGLSEDENLAHAVHEFDLILGAHTHHVLNEGLKINGTWINQCGRSGKFAGEVTVEFEKEENGRFQTLVKRVESLEVNQELRDKETAEKLQTLAVKGEQQLNEHVTTLPAELTVDWHRESEFALLLAETLSEWCGADISMVNSGVLLNSLPAGSVTLKDLHAVCPHPINPAVVKISGERLLEIIRQSRKDEMVNFALKGFGFRGKILGYMVFNNISFTDTSRYLNGRNVIVAGQPLQKDRIYSLATVDMFTFGHLYPAITSIKEKQYFMPEFLRDLLAWKLRNQKDRKASSC